MSQGEARSPNRAPSNVTKFRQDRRGQVCGLLKSIGLLGLLCALVYCIWNYHEQLSWANLRQMAGYFSNAWAAGEEGFAGYTFEAGTDSVYEEFGSGLAVMGSDTLSFINAKGKAELSVQLKYTTPALSVADGNMLAYDRGGKGLCLTNRYTALWQTTLQSDILYASINSNGAFSLVTDEQGYRAAVSLYDNRQKKRFQWNTSEFYIARSCVAPDSQRLAALCMTDGGGKRNSLVRVFSIHQQEPLFDVDLGGMTVYSMEYYSDDALMLITDAGVFSYDGKGQLQGEFAYDKGALITYSHRMGQLPCVALETGDQALRSRVVVVGEGGRAAYDKSFAQQVRSVSSYGAYVCALLWDGVARDQLLGGNLEIAPEINARDVILRSDGSVMLIYADRAELLEFGGGPTEE